MFQFDGRSDDPSKQATDISDFVVAPRWEMIHPTVPEHGRQHMHKIQCDAKPLQPRRMLVSAAAIEKCTWLNSTHAKFALIHFAICLDKRQCVGSTMWTNTLENLCLKQTQIQTIDPM